jgi:multidrug resistance efflux pump
VLVVLAGGMTLVESSLTVSSEAVLLPLEMSTVRSALDGVVAEVLVDEGQRVREGDVLARLSAGDHRVALARTEAAVSSARIELEQLQKGNRQEEVDRVRARVNGLNREVGIAGSRVRRLSGQVKQGIAPREELDSARAQHAALSGQLAEANAELRLMLAGAPPEEIAKKQSELRTLEAQLEQDRKSLDATLVKSRMTGTVVTQKPKEKVNARVAQGDALFEIVESQRMKAEVLISERDFDVLALGLPLQIKVPAYPGRSFAGTVKRVAQRVETLPKLGAVIRVEGEIENPEGLLVPNMTGVGVIDCGRRSWAEILVRRVARWFRLHILL